MGSPEDEEGRFEREKQHVVEITKPHSTIICPFITIQWPGNVQRNG
jgi:hypothetical protein